MAERIQMTMAKATPADFDTIIQFFNWLESWAEDGTETIVRDGEEVDVEITDEVFALRMRAHMSRWTRRPNVLACWSRVVFGAQMLIDNCCDPNLDHLEWRPDVLAFLEQQKAEAKAKLLQDMTEPELGAHMTKQLRFIKSCHTADTIGSMLIIFQENGITQYGATIDPETAPQALRELADRLESRSTVKR